MQPKEYSDLLRLCTYSGQQLHQTALTLPCHSVQGTAGMSLVSRQSLLFSETLMDGGKSLEDELKVLSEREKVSG